MANDINFGDLGNLLDMFNITFDNDKICDFVKSNPDKSDATTESKTKKTDTGLTYRLLKKESGAVVIVNVPGRTKEDVSVTSSNKDNGITMLNINVISKPADYDETTKIHFDNIVEAVGELHIPFKPAYDFGSLSASVKNGQLFISIPKKPELEPRTFVVE